jgi:uncharacterized protein
MWLTALIMGVAGSLHCAGMCSPLALAITNTNKTALTNRILYNLGRILTYGILGGIVAGVGYSLPLTGFQNALSLLLGLCLILMAVLGYKRNRIRFVTNALLRFSNQLKKLFSHFIQRKTPGALLLMGAINGLLPCGLTFLALSVCLTLAAPIDGFIYMLLFGVGTLPVMLGFVSVIELLTRKLQWDIRTITTGMMVLSGVLLIARVFLMHVPEAHQHTSVLEIVVCR